MTLVGDLIGSLPRGTPNIRTGLIAGTRVDRGYRTVGRRAVLGLSYARQPIPAGRLRISGRIVSRRPVFLRIYDGYSELADFAPVELAPILLPLRGGRFDTIAQAPRLTTMRIDAPHGDTEFTLSKLKIREVGIGGLLLGRAGNLARRFIEDPRGTVAFIGRATTMIFSTGGLALLRHALMRPQQGATYQHWISLFDDLLPEDIDAIEVRIAAMERTPKISVIMPAYNSVERWLRSAIESVSHQLYRNWELCIADDGSTDPNVARLVRQYAASDKRIKFFRVSKNKGISAASNIALSMATGEFVALLDHDDELSPHALYVVAQEIVDNPDANLIYSDEDKIDSHGRRFEPYFKSTFNRELFYAHNMISHLGVYRTAMVRDLGGFRTKFDGSQDYDLALRFIESVPPRTIRHLPHVLYHWRAVPGSVAHSAACKNYAHEAARAALQAHFARIALKAVSIATYNGTVHRALFDRGEQPRVSIIVPTRDRLDLLRPCLSTLRRRTAYPDIEVIVIDNASADPAMRRYLRWQKKRGAIRVLRYDGPFNFADMNNRAAAIATGEILCFLNNDTEVQNADWLGEMVSHALRPDVGMVGAKLYDSARTIQHGGIILVPDWMAWHAHAGLPAQHTGYFGRAILHQELSAVTAACCALRRDLFLDAGGFDAKTFAVHYNDIDLCLRLRQRGFRIVWTPFAELIHRGSASLGLTASASQRPGFAEEARALRERWGAFLADDPFFSPNLATYSPEFLPAFPPRAAKPWFAAAN
jgi:GT2 family glycosyltransferase